MAYINSNVEIKTYALRVCEKDIYEEINSLMIDNFKNRTIPYLQNEPLPQDMNIVNGRHLADINKIQLELKAAQIGAKSLKWIYGADAVLMGLELKNPQNSPSDFQKAKQNSPSFNTEPVIGFASVRRDISKSAYKIQNENNIIREGIKMEAQTIYLLDQFTPQSIERALNQNNIEETLDLRGNELSRKMKTTIAKNMLKNIAEYDAGIRESELRKNKLNNIRQNLNQNSEYRKLVEDNYSKIINSYVGENAIYKKNIFALTNQYYIKQSTSAILGKSPDEQMKQKLALALNNLAMQNSPALATTLADSFFYSERLTHYGFSPEKVYTQLDMNKKQSVLSPAASHFEDRIPDSLAAERTLEKLKVPEREQVRKSPEPQHRLGR